MPLEYGALGVASPNLDDYSVDPSDLQSVSVELGCVSGTLHDLSVYALLKSRAMRYRLAGDVGQALTIEKDMETIYSQLPPWAKW